MQFFKDLAERALKTFVEAFAVTFVMPSSVWNGSAWEAAALAGAAAGISAVVSLLSKQFGSSKDSASVL